jgi:hypothetical protein
VVILTTKYNKMNLNDLKIDDDLVEYVSTKPNVNEFVNQCIRDAKAKEPEVPVLEEIVSENKGEQPPIPPVNDQFIKFALRKERYNYICNAYISYALQII